jgi:hypothetical protein
MFLELNKQLNRTLDLIMSMGLCFALAERNVPTVVCICSTSPGNVFKTTIDGRPIFLLAWV